MQTKVEIEIPFGQEEALFAAATGVGGKVVGVHEAPISAAGGINPRRLLRHLGTHGVQMGKGRDFSDYPKDVTYSALFDFLRGLPENQQSSLLGSYLNLAMRDQQAGVQTGRFLARVNSINWLEPQEEPSVQELQSISDEFYQQLNLPFLPVAVVRDWHTLGGMVYEGFTDRTSKKGNLYITFSASRDAWVSQLDRQARTNLGDHRDYREAYAVRSLVDSIFHDIDGGHWGDFGGRIRELIYFGGEGYSSEDHAKMGATAAIRADAQLAATSLVLDKHLPGLGYTEGTVGEGLFNGIYDKGYVFMGPMSGQSVVFAPKTT